MAEEDRLTATEKEKSRENRRQWHRWCYSYRSSSWKSWTRSPWENACMPFLVQIIQYRRPWNNTSVSLIAESEHSFPFILSKISEGRISPVQSGLMVRIALTWTKCSVAIQRSSSGRRKQWIFLVLLRWVYYQQPRRLRMFIYRSSSCRCGTSAHKHVGTRNYCHWWRTMIIEQV